MTELVKFDRFFDAEEYHQDYYKKNPLRYKYYRHGSGRDQFLEKVWGSSRSALRPTTDNPYRKPDDLTHALAGTVLLEDLGQPTAAYQHLRAALETGPRPETAAVVRQGLAAIEGLQKRRIGRLHSAPF